MSAVTLARAMESYRDAFWRGEDGPVDQDISDAFKCVPAHGFADLAIKLRMLLYVSAGPGGRWLEAAAFGAPVPDFDQLLYYGDYRDQILWSAIVDAERMAGMSRPSSAEWVDALAA